MMEIESLRKDSNMHRTLIIGLTTLSLVAAAPLLSACHSRGGTGHLGHWAGH